MQYLSNTWQQDDIKFNATIINEMKQYITYTNVCIIIEYARNLPDVEKLTRIFEKCNNNVLHLDPLFGYREMKISWDTLPHQYDQKKYVLSVEFS